MFRSSPPKLLLLVFLIAVNFGLLRLVEQSGNWSFQQLLLRGTMFGLLSCVCIACCRRNVAPLNLALVIVTLAAIGSVPSSWSPFSFSRAILDDFTKIWFLGLIIQMIAVAVSYFLLSRVPAKFDKWLDNIGDKPQNETVQTPRSQQAWQLSTRGLISLTSAVAVLLSCTLWLKTDSQTAFLTLIIFGCCGTLTAINFWSADRYDTASACTGTLLITLGVAALLKLFQLDLQQWLTAVFFTTAVQTTVLLAALARCALRTPIAANDLNPART